MVFTDPQKIKALELEVAKAMEAERRSVVYANASSAEILRRIDRRKGKDPIEGLTDRERGAWGHMFMETAELRLLIAKRALLLAQYGLDDPADLMTLTVKEQPERLGVLVIGTFFDRLAAIEPKYFYDALFTLDGADTHRAFHDPVAKTREWLRDREASGKPWVKGQEDAAGDERRPFEDIKAEFLRLRKIIYPNKEYLNDKRPHPYTPEQVHDILAALATAGEAWRHPVWLRIMRLDLDAITAAQALDLLRAYQLELKLNAAPQPLA